MRIDDKEQQFGSLVPDFKEESGEAHEAGKKPEEEFLTIEGDPEAIEQLGEIQLDL